MEDSLSNRKRLKQSTLDDSPKRKRSKKNDTKERRAGVITNMVLKNFMCHSLLEVNFTTNTSVVIGRNGSGKSALLTALIIGLGGKANLTNRGTNIKGFVKAGKTSASVSITLHNDGSMAYRPSIYGPSITIVRNFTASGSSSYRIKNHEGGIVSNQAKEIQNITSSLNIQVDNPICILNQDTSRNFLCSSDPKDKFTLFMKATKLETLATEYNRVMTNGKESVRLLEDKKNDIEKMGDDLRKLKSKIDQHKSARNLREEEAFLHNELLWSKVQDAELEVETQNGELESLSKKYDNCKGNAEKRMDKIKSLKDSIRETEQRITELKDAIQVQSRPHAEAKKTLDNLTTLYEAKERMKNKLQIGIKSKNQDIRVLEQEIANANQNKNVVEDLKIERANKIKQIEQKIKANDDILQTARNEVFQVKTDIARREQDEDNLKQEIREIDKKIKQHRDRINSLKNDKGNTLLLYGSHIPKVKQLIDQSRRQFQKVPRGPLGSYIKLKEKKWAVAAEGYLGANLLKSFIVDNNHDNEVLLQIFRKAGIDHLPTIITSKFFDKVHNVSKNLVSAPSDCISLFEILEIEDPVVANCIIDESSVEGILLIPNDERAMDLLSNRTNVPVNCTQGITSKGDRYYPDPNYKTYCSEYHQARYLQIGTGEHLRNLKQEIDNLEQQKQAVMSQYSHLKNEINVQIRQRNELEDKIRTLIGNRSDLRRELDAIQSTAEPEAANIEVLENELVEVKGVINERKADLEKINEEIKELKVPIEETQVRLKKFKETVKNLEDRLPPMQEEIRSKNIRIRELSTTDEFDNRKIAEFEARLQEYRGILVTKQAKLHAYLEKAQNVGVRPDTIRKVPEIMQRLSGIEREIRQIQSSTEKVEDVVEQYKELDDKFSKASEILEKLNENVMELKTAARIRKKHYKITESYFMSYIKHSFKKILEIRQFKGSLDIDVDTKKLELIVMPQQGSQGLTTTSNLSGGERSFSTVAFLYSLWQCMEFPFYFLDEFDVYMDKLNRTKVFDILLHHTDSKPQLQFVFLTPQDVSFLDNNVTVLKLEDPRGLE